MIVVAVVVMVVVVVVMLVFVNDDRVDDGVGGVESDCGGQGDGEGGGN